MINKARAALGVAQRVAKECDYLSVRFFRRQDLRLSFRQNVFSPPESSDSFGVMISVVASGGIGYGATSDLSEQGIAAASQQAMKWAVLCGKRPVADFASVPWQHGKAEYTSRVQKPWRDLSFSDQISLIQPLSEDLAKIPGLVDHQVELWQVSIEQVALTNHGGEAWQNFEYLGPGMYATAAAGGEVQTRSFGARAYFQQGGVELLERVGFNEAAARRVGEEALQLAKAPDCPTGNMSLLLAPDQMVLQIHESIGHPLELDRILGDERNYAGTSFVTTDMFGKYQYGSPLLNVTFDPTIEEETASYAMDDDGMPAQKEYIIKDGLLLRPLGGTVSQHRSGAMAGVANTRAVSWNRPPIDRMANLNVEPGEQNWQQLVEGIERGILMRTNCSWSIDDSRNKFQFGCEWGQLIENGELKGVVKKPNYRGVSAKFWRDLVAVGDLSTREVMGTPFCGKGEPNQMIHVGHASPACVFSGVDVFGGA